MPFLKKKSDCTACSSCVASCPVQCITMQADGKGFLYPVIDEQKCIHCHRCERVCPALHAPNTPQNLDARPTFAGITRNSTVWEDSTSGGAFSEICHAWSKNDADNTWVFGASFENLRVVHKGALLEDISLFRKSKYVQSQIGTCFCQIKKLLEENKRVIFSGTPCQVAGLRNFLGKDYLNLLCIDLICHGVGSPAVFERYLIELEHKTDKKICDYMFRAKRSYWGNFLRHQSKVTYEDNSVRYYIEDNYNKLFLKQLCLRDSCGEHCRYRQVKRYGDFTIADFNAFPTVFPRVNDGRNYSTLICNTAKAMTLLPTLEQTMQLLPCSLEKIIQYNPLLARSTPENPQRPACLQDFEKGLSVEQLVDKYVIKSRFSILACLKRHTPFTVKHFIFRVYKRLWK